MSGSNEVRAKREPSKCFVNMVVEPLSKPVQLKLPKVNRTQRSTQSQPKVNPKSTQSQPKVDPANVDPKVNPKVQPKGQPKVNPKSTQSQSKVNP